MKNKATKSTTWVMLFCLLFALLTILYIFLLLEDNTECPSGYKCEKIQGNCYIENRNSITVLWNGKYDVFEYNKGIEREMVKKVISIRLNNGTEIPRCEEGK